MNKKFGIQLHFSVLLVIFIVSGYIDTFAQFKASTIKNTSFLEFEEKVITYYPVIRYNRVEGLFLGGGLKVNSKAFWAPTLHGDVGYGISNEEIRYKAGLYKDFSDFNKLRLGGVVFHQTASLDDWFIRSIENSLAALLFKEDFMNYFGKKGFTVYVNKFFMQQNLQFRVEVSNYDYESLERTTQWAIFGKDKKFKENPMVKEGNETSIKIIMSVDERDNPLFPNRGVIFDVIYERTSGDFKTNGIFLVMGGYQPVFQNQQIRTRTVIGARSGDTEKQHLLDLGGLGTLPGFKDKEFRNGNRLLLYNFRYLFRGDLLGNLPFTFVPLYDALNLSLFFNTGWLRFEETESGFGSFPGFEKIQLSQMKTDVGFGLSVSNETVLVDFAKRTDRSKDSWRITARIMYRF